MKEVGTYRKAFDPTVTALSEILEQRDRTLSEFVKGGSQVMVEVVSDRGAVNQKQNPLLQLWGNLNTQALAYWRDLGLTPAGLKKLNDAVMKEQKSTVLELALKKINGA